MRTGTVATLMIWLVATLLSGQVLGAPETLPGSSSTSASAATRPTVWASTRVSATTSPAGAATEPSDEFLRFVPDGSDGGTLQAAIASYRNGAGQTVDLIAAVHVADPAFYRTLNEQFKHEDVVLYELVMPRDMAIAELHDPNRPSSWVTMFQHFLTNTLKLQFQLDGINYDAPNFVHADMDTDTFAKRQAARGESMMSLMLRAMMQGLSQSDDDPTGGVGPLLLAMSNPDKALGLKLMLAREFGKMDEMMASMEGPDGTVLIDERNKAAIAVLKQQLAAGKRRVGIFYGAGHLQGMEKILEEQLGFKKVGVWWNVAWDMTPKATTAPAR